VLIPLTSQVTFYITFVVVVTDLTLMLSLSRVYAKSGDPNGACCLRPWMLPWATNCGLKGVLEPDCHVMSFRSYSNFTAELVKNWVAKRHRLDQFAC